MKSLILIISTAVATAAVYILIFFLKTGTAEMEIVDLRYASVPSIVEAPAHIALSKGFFAEEGLDIEWIMNPDGKTSLEQLLEGQVDIASVTATPVVYASFDRDDFCIIGQIDHHLIHSITANSESGITGIYDLKGQRAAVMLGTSGQYFMESWMLFNGIEPVELELVDLNGPESVKALDDGRVDIMFCWFPFPVYAEKELGDRAVVFEAENMIPISWVIVVRKEYLDDNQDTVRRFLKALYKGEEFIREKSDEALLLHSEVSGVPPEITGSLFHKMAFHLTLDNLLILDLESQARWLIARKYVNASKIPNYLDYISSGPLRELNQGDVSLIERAADED